MHSHPMPRRRFTPAPQSRVQAEPEVCLPEPYATDAHLEPLPPGAYGLPGPAFLYARGERDTMMDSRAMVEAMRDEDGEDEDEDEHECPDDGGAPNSRLLRGQSPDELLCRIPLEADGVLFPATAASADAARPGEPIYVLLVRPTPRASAWPYIMILVALLIAGVIAVLVVRGNARSEEPWNEGGPGAERGPSGEDDGFGEDGENGFGEEHEENEIPGGESLFPNRLRWERAERALRDFDERLQAYTNGGDEVDMLPRSASIEELARLVGYDEDRLRSVEGWESEDFRFRRNGDRYYLEVYVNEADFVRLHDDGTIQRPD